MALTTLVLVSTMCLIQLTGCSLVDDLSCANLVHDECKQCNFNDEAIHEGNKEVFCRRIQACAECLGVPRCPSKYLQRFINLLVTTMKISEKFCSHTAKYHKSFVKLKHLKGSGVCTGVSKGSRSDECGHRCECEDGNISVCVRIRKEFTQMTFDERRRFVDVYYKATMDPHYRSEFLHILDKHSQIPSDYLHHMPQIFLPWHRWFLLEIENFLRRIDCRVTVPYYDWSVRYSQGTAWRSSDPTDVWNAGPQGIGGNGVAPSYCVQDGKFREGNWNMPEFIKGPSCLKRNFDFKCPFYTKEKIEMLLRTSFHQFEEETREELHSTFHDCVGGNMPQNELSAFSPEIIFHHSFIDKLWSQFQARGPTYKYDYFPSINYRMPFADMFPVQVLDNNNLPGDVAVEYEEMKDDQQNDISKDGKISESEEDDSIEAVMPLGN